MKCKALSNKTSKGLEKEINKWLVANPNVQIKYIAQGGSGIGIVTTIFYE